MKRSSAIGLGIALAGVILIASRKRASAEASTVTLGNEVIEYDNDDSLADYGDGQVGKYFSIDEVLDSATCNAAGVYMEADETQLAAALKLAQYVLDPIRDFLGGPLHVNNWLRNAACIQALKAAGYHPAEDSTHLGGGTADVEFFLNGVQANHLIIRALLALEVPFDRVIIEEGTWDNPNWVHIEYDGSKPASEQRKIIARISGGQFSTKSLEWAENHYL